jgi:heme-binding HmuY-like protein
MKYFNLILVIFALGLVACFKEDEMVQPHDPGNVEVAQIEMTKDYRYQVYFDLEAANVVDNNLKTEWDLGFEASANGWHIILNTANFMWAGRTALKDISQQVDTNGINWKFDNSNGALDMTAVGDWLQITENDTTYDDAIFVINRGYTPSGALRGVKKVAFRNVDKNSYTIEFGDLNSASPETINIQKDSTLNFVFFSFDEGIELNLEPPKMDWHLWFTQYTTILFTDAGDAYPYLVTGALINKYNGVKVAKDSVHSFDELDYSLAASLSFSDSLDVIGYDWKVVVGDVQTGNVTYVVDEKLNYIIRAGNDIYYKLRFVDFYNNLGDKGYPKFEFQKL